MTTLPGGWVDRFAVAIDASRQGLLLDADQREALDVLLLMLREGERDEVDVEPEYALFAWHLGEAGMVTHVEYHESPNLIAVAALVAGLESKWKMIQIVPIADAPAILERVGAVA